MLRNCVTPVFVGGAALVLARFAAKRISLGGGKAGSTLRGEAAPFAVDLDATSTAFKVETQVHTWCNLCGQLDSNADECQPGTLMHTD
jgi:hypothetical protein